MVDPRFGPRHVLNMRWSRPSQGLKRPEVAFFRSDYAIGCFGGDGAVAFGPVRAIADPGSNVGNLIVLELASRRHLDPVMSLTYNLEQKALVGIARLNCGTGLPAF